MELRAELENADRLMGEVLKALTALRKCLQQVQVLEKEALVASRDTEVIQVTEYYMTRKEAADFIGKSVRQLDRLCGKNTIVREEIDGQIRIRKSELMRYKGYELEGEDGLSIVQRIHKRYLGNSGRPPKK